MHTFGSSSFALSPEVLLRMAQACHQQGKFAEAEKIYRDALRLQPEACDVLHWLGVLKHQTGSQDEALVLLNRAIAIRSDWAVAHNHRGLVLHAKCMLIEALGAFDEALRLHADYADAHNNRGAVLKDLRRPAEALAAYDEALRLHGDMPDAHNNRGVVLQDLRRFDEALQAYADAQRVAPEYAEAHWNEARCRLLLGDYENAWPKYEWRWKRASFLSRYRQFAQPRWSGERLSNKAILLHAEQGLGDTLQFLRYVPLVREQAAKLILEIQAPLVPLLADWDGVQIVAKGDALPRFDVHCPLLSLANVIETRVDNIPGSIPCVRANQDLSADWAARLGPRNRRRVGLVWSGNPAQQDNDLRSMPLADLLGLGEIPGIELFSLQKELRTDEEKTLVERGCIRHFGDELRSFADTAALLDNMDVIVSVCTSVAHLAGVMGKPVWVMLQYAHDWRWLLDREDSPWYPSARLFRQSRQGDWSPVLASIAGELRALT